MNIMVWKKRAVAVLAAVLAAGIAGYAALYPASAYAADRQLPIYCVDKGEQKICSISFDAAWGNEDTQTLIDILERFHVKTTFFVVGDWVDKYPESVQALHDAGHEIMSHSAHHDHYNSLTTDQITADLKESCDKIEAAVGVRPSLIRCPYGEYDNHVVQAIRAYGMEPVQWDVDSLDWKEIPATQIVQRVVGKVKPGSIVLFHNAAKHTPEALPEILTNLIGQGYSIVPISQLIVKGDCDRDYTIDHTGRQIAAPIVSQTEERRPDSSGDSKPAQPAAPAMDPLPPLVDNVSPAGVVWE